MDMRFDQFGTDRPVAVPRLAALVAGPDATSFAAPPLDWPGLAARLGAAHAVRRALAGPQRVSRAASGSFAPDLALHIAACRGPGGQAPAPALSSPPVNQTAKADGKPPGSIAENSKGTDPQAVRGQS